MSASDDWSVLFDPFASATWQDQITTEKAAKQLLDWHVVRLAFGREVPVPVANAVARGVHDSLQVSPHAQVDTVRVMNQSSTLQHPFVHYDPVMRTIELASAFRVLKVLQAQLAKNAPGRSYESTIEAHIAHAVGHAAHAEYRVRKKQEIMETGLRATDEFKVERARQLQVEGLYRAINYNGGIKSIGEIASKSLDEAVAEGFAEVVTKGDAARDVSKAIVEELNKGALQIILTDEEPVSAPA